MHRPMIWMLGIVLGWFLVAVLFSVIPMAGFIWTAWEASAGSDTYGERLCREAALEMIYG